MTDESQGGSVLFGFPEEWPRSGAHQPVCDQSALQLLGPAEEEKACGPLVASLE